MDKTLIYHMCIIISNASLLLVALQIVWENRLQGDTNNDCLISVDGTHFHVKQPTDFDVAKKFFSYKFEKPALSYEVALCIMTGDIVWIHGPFPGSFHDITIFRDSLLSHLEAGERVEADDGYIGEAPHHVKCPRSFTNPKETTRMQQLVRSRQETVNARFKDWGCLKQSFRHDLVKHSNCFRSVAVLTQLSIDSGERLFKVIYSDNEEVAKAIREGRSVVEEDVDVDL
jgi:DDE superfamily endonuclease